MEKSSEKLIRGTSPLKNRFKDMLSQVQLKVPAQVQAKKKNNNLVLVIDPYFDRNSSKLSQKEPTIKAANKKIESMAKNQNKQNRLGTNFSQILKNQSFKQSLTPTQKLRNFTKSKIFLGKHWQSKVKLAQFQLLQYSFSLIKSQQIQQSYTFNKISSVNQFQRIKQLVNLLNRIEYIKVRDSFEKMIKIYSDSLLFGLSSTIGELKDNSFLRLESEYGHLALQTGMQLKKQPNVSQKDSTLGMMSKKVSESAASQSLSGLILNHNKLNLQIEGNQGYPNIPKSNRNISNKLIPSNKEIEQLSLQTKKKIESNKKIAEDYDLPLESRKKLNDQNIKQAIKQSAMKREEQKGNSPITFTYILKNLDSHKLIPNIISHDSLESKKKAQDSIKQIKTSEVNPIAESHNRQAMRNVFLEPGRQQAMKRSISLQIKHYPGLYISPEKPNNQANPIKRYNNQYYNQYNCNRQNLRKINIDNLVINEVKPRAKSATPKITFNFCSGIQQHQPQPLNTHVLKPNVKQKFQQSDCIVQRSLLNDKNPHLVQVNSLRQMNQQVKNRIQIISPSHRRQQKSITQKLKAQQRQRIKQKILPPIFNQYYSNESSHPQKQSNKRISILASSNSSTSPSAGEEINQKRKNQLKQFKKGFVNQLYFGEIQYQQAGCMPAFCQKAEQNVPKYKSHKEKILVTYSHKQRT